MSTNLALFERYIPINTEYRRTLYVFTLADNELDLDWKRIVGVHGDIEKLYYSGPDRVFVVFKDPLVALDVASRRHLRKLRLFGNARIHPLINFLRIYPTYQERMAFFHFNTIVRKPGRAEEAQSLARDVMMVVRGSGVVTKMPHPDGKCRACEDGAELLDYAGEVGEANDEVYKNDEPTDDIIEGTDALAIELNDSARRSQEEMERIRDHFHLIDLS